MDNSTRSNSTFTVYKRTWTMCNKTSLNNASRLIMETYLLKNTEYTHLIKQRRLGGYEIIHTDTSAQLGYTVGHFIFP